MATIPLPRIFDGMESFSTLLGGLLTLVLLTSFAKVFTVLCIVRVGVGLEGAGMSLIVGAVALLVSAVAMQPQLEPIGGLEGLLRGELRVSEKALEGYFRPFLARHADPGLTERLHQLSLGRTNTPDGERAESVVRETAAGPSEQVTAEAPPGTPNNKAVSTVSFPVIALSFLITELREALELGLLFLLPFVVIDLLVVNGLAALGITSISARALSLPLKLLLFISVDGWGLIVEKLIGGYTG